MRGQGRKKAEGQKGRRAEGRKSKSGLRSLRGKRIETAPLREIS